MSVAIPVAFWPQFALIVGVSLTIGSTMTSCAAPPPTNSATNSATNLPLSRKLDPTKMDETDRRIQQHRMGNVQLKVVDKAGKPIANAAIQLTQTRHHFPFGVALSTDIFAIDSNASEPDRQRYREMAGELFNAAVHENALKWLENEPKQGEISYVDADAIWDWTQQNQMTMRGHTLFWEVEKFNQDWIKKLKPNALGKVMQARVEDVCSRYKGRIDEFDVFNEVLHGDFYRKRMGDRVFADMFKACQQANPDVKLYTNDFAILEGDKASAYVQQITKLKEQGAPIGGIGIQAHLEAHDKPTPASMEKTLDRLGEFGLPIKITELSIQADDEQAQATKLRDFLRTTFAHRAVEGVMFWGFWEGNQYLKPAALYRQDWTEKPAGKMYRDLVFGEWWTQERLQTNATGNTKTRAFYGNYEAKVTAKIAAADRTKVISFVVTPEDKAGKTVTVKLE